MRRPSIKTTIYQRFRGADFSTDQALIDKSRSPFCTNMVSDAGGMPEKRCGWRSLHRMSGEIHGLFMLVTGGRAMFYAHAGRGIYSWDDSETAPQKIYELPEGEYGTSQGFQMGDKLYIVTGVQFLVCDGEGCHRVAEDGYIPTTVIARDPSGGGRRYEDINMLSPWRRNSFQTDGKAKTFLLDATDIDDAEVSAEVWGEPVTDFTVDREAGTVTFENAPAAPGAGSADGLVVTFAKTVEGYSDIVERCTIITGFGAGAADRLFLSGNPDHLNQDYYSGLSDPTYFADLAYSDIGGEGTAIMGYHRIGNTQAIIKEDNGQDSTVFFRTASVDGDGNVIFAVQQGIVGVGASSKGSFANLLDEPLFLSGTGIFAVTTNYLTGDRVGQNRSYYINPKLQSEEVTKGQAVTWSGMYLLSFPNGHVYVLDATQNKSYQSESLGDFCYEGYFWDNIPAVCWMKYEVSGREYLYFGTADGRICKFNNDIPGVQRFKDDGKGIRAVWATKLDDDGDPTILKTMMKRGCAVTVKPYSRASVQICVRTDKDAEDRALKEENTDYFQWDDIDLKKSKGGNENARDVFLNTKVKNYKRLQILVKNEVPGEGFGIFEITKHFVFGNYAKR